MRIGRDWLGLMCGGLALVAMLPGCGGSKRPPEPPTYSMPGAYAGLADKTVAIVIYPQPGLEDEYPAAREDLSRFVFKEMREHLPTTRLVEYKDVINWQDDTENWFGLSGKAIGTHFSVDRVLMIELLEYTGQRPHGYSELQGRVRAVCKVYETDGAAREPAWWGVVDVKWPPDRALDPTRTGENAVRLQTLETFSAGLVGRFYTPTGASQAP